MNERDVAVLRLLEAFEPPKPAPNLERRVLSAARAALDTAPAHDRWSALRWSRPLRVAWAAAVVLLALGNVLLSRRSEVRRALPGPTLASSLRAASGELAEIAKLPRIDAAAQSLGGLIAAGAGESVDPERGVSGVERRKGSAS